MRGRMYGRANSGTDDHKRGSVCSRGGSKDIAGPPKGGTSPSLEVREGFLVEVILA